MRSKRRGRSLTDGWCGSLWAAPTSRATPLLKPMPSSTRACAAAVKPRQSFLDDVPSSRLVAPVYYYQGVARDGLKSAGARESFKTFLALRTAATSEAR